MLETLQSYTEIPSAEWQKMLSLLLSKKLSAGEYFIRQGDSPKYMAFILSGIFRVFCLKESGDEKTLSFRTRGQFLSAFSPPKCA